MTDVMEIGTKPGVVGATMLTLTGLYFDFLDPRPEQIDPRDIAYGLSNCCRFGGQCKPFYSVAEHCVLASNHVPAEDAFTALLHDAAEAYTGDIISPLKQLLPDFKIIEARVEAAIARKFGLTLPYPRSVKHIDLRLLRTERRDLMHSSGGDWPSMAGYEYLPMTMTPLSPESAQLAWLRRFNALCPAGAQVAIV